MFNAELQRHLLTVESGKCAVHSAVVGVSYKTIIELDVYFMNVKFSAKPHNDLNSFHSWPR